MKLTINEIKEMVRSCLSLLNEAVSKQDAYERFYKGKIDQELFDKLMEGTEVMTPFHKECLDLLSKGDPAYIQGFEDSICSSAAEAWNKSLKGQQFLTNVAKEKSRCFDTPTSLLNFLAIFNQKKYFSEVEYVDNGLVKLYESDKWLVTCTTSYAASKKYYGDSHWCTASDIGGAYDGFEMFMSYTTQARDSILLQFVDKTNRENSYQVQAGGQSSVCDFFDKPKRIDDVIDAMGHDWVRANEIIKKEYPRLSDETKKMVREEYSYWKFRFETLVKSSLPKVKDIVNSKELDEEAIRLIKMAFEGFDYESDDELPEVYEPSFHISQEYKDGDFAIYTMFINPSSSMDDDEKQFMFFKPQIQSAIDIIARSDHRALLKKTYIINDSNYTIVKSIGGIWPSVFELGQDFVLIKDQFYNNCVAAVIDKDTFETILEPKEKCVYTTFGNGSVMFYKNDAPIYSLNVYTGRLLAKNNKTGNWMELRKGKLN